jgi:hypothetical protein
MPECFYLASRLTIGEFTDAGPLDSRQKHGNTPPKDGDFMHRTLALPHAMPAALRRWCARRGKCVCGNDRKAQMIVASRIARQKRCTTGR